jgi:hypothetical protein
VVDSTADEQALKQWSSIEKEASQRQRNESLQAQYEEDTNPSRRSFHKFIALMSFVAMCAALNMVMGQFVGYFFHEEGPIQYILRLYVIALCFLAILVELEWTKFARESAILRYWITRGLFYCFLGVIGLEQNDTEGGKNSDMRGFNVSGAYISMAALIMTGVGAAYSLMGLCCLQIYYNRLRSDYEARLRRADEFRETTERYNDQNGVV